MMTIVRRICMAATFMCVATPGKAAASCPTSAIRFASSSNTIYVAGPDVICRLSDIASRVPATALALTDSSKRIWNLRANLVVEKGGELHLHGTAIGGDVNEFRLKSNDSSATGSRVFLRAYWGMVSIKNTKITSWDESAKGPDTKPGSNGRAFIHVRSFLDSSGVARESRMDIDKSNIGYLGFNAAESYGLTWKVSGTTAGIFDKVNVHGNVTNSVIHHNYFGAYTYGAFQMRWEGNEFASNVKYGLDPHDDSDELVVDNNTFHDNGNHGFICSQRCDHLTITNNESYRNVGNGIMLHRSVTDSIVEGNVTWGNTDSGIALFESSRNIIRNNTVADNVRGIRFSVGSSDNLFEGNEIVGNSSYAIYSYKGTDAPVAGDGRPRRNVFLKNLVHDNAGDLVNLGDSDDNLFLENTFSGPKGFVLKRGAGNVFERNTMAANVPFSVIEGTSSVPSSAILNNAEVAVAVKLSGVSSVRFNSTESRLYDGDNRRLSTTVTPAGTSALISSTSSSVSVKVRPLAFWTRITGGSAVAVPGSDWTSGSTRTWSWTASGNTNLNVTIGKLAASANYEIRRDGTKTATVKTTSDGTLESTQAAKSGKQEFKVVPAT